MAAEYLGGIGGRKKMRCTLAEFWEYQEVITRQNGYHGTQFRANFQTTQRGLTFTTLFNVAVENMV